MQINFYIYAIAFIWQKIHPGANYTYMYNLNTVCKSAHVNGALDICDSNCLVFLCLNNLHPRWGIIFRKGGGCTASYFVKIIGVPFGFVNPLFWGLEELFCGRRRVAVARYRMMCLVILTGWYCNVATAIWFVEYFSLIRVTYWFFRYPTRADLRYNKTFRDNTRTICFPLLL